MSELMIRADAGAALRKLRLGTSNTEKARRHGMNLIARFMVTLLARLSPTDTNRYIRGWIQAGMVAGIAGLPLLPPLQESKYHKKAVRRMGGWMNTLRLRLRALEQQRDFLYPRGRPKKGGKAYDRLGDKIKTARERYLRASQDLETLEGDPYALVIGASRGKGRAQLPGNTTDLARRDQITKGHTKGVSIRSKVYGGSGYLYHEVGKSTLHLHNREAHVKIIEAKYGVWRRVKAMMKVRTVNRQVAADIGKALQLASRLEGYRG